jgi:hypothetical protein
MKMIEAKQIQLIHIAQAQLCLSDDNYRGIIAAQTKGKKTSSKDLTYFEADAVINYFVKTLGFKIKSNYIRTAGAARRAYWHPANARRNTGPLPGDVYVICSPAQFDQINFLIEKIAWKVEGGYWLWLKKYIKIDRVKTADQASRTIEGLKGLLAHQGDKNGEMGN